MTDMGVSVHANLDIAWYVKDTHGRIAVINERNKEMAGPFTTVADAWKWIRWNLPRAESWT
jgi:hypothetical protein